MGERRRNNEGSIYQIDGGGWEAAVTMARGKRRRLRRASYDEARIARDQLLKERDEQIQADRRLTVGQLVDEYLDFLKVTVRRPRTWQVYEKDARLHIKPALGDVRAALLTPTQYRVFQTDLLRGDKARKRPPLAPATVALIRTVLNGAYNWACAEERLPRNPVALIRPPRRDKYTPSPLSVKQAIAVLTAIRNHPLGPFWAFLLATGCRFGEAAGLKWDDVDLETATVWLGFAKAPIPKAFREPGERTWEIDEMKTRASQRPVPLTRFCVAALARQSEIVAELRQQRRRGRWEEHGLVFTSEVGTPLRDDHVGERWHAVLIGIELEEKGKPQFRLHDLRHTLGTLQRRSGTDLKAIQELLGHASISMTGDVYLTSAVPEALREAIERYDRLLTPAAPEAAVDVSLLPELLPGDESTSPDQERAS